MLPLVALLLVAVAAGGLLLARLAVATTEVARARTAADAAALAGAAGGEDAAREVAYANGGTLVGWSDPGVASGGSRRVVVTVRLGGAEATAAAETALACVDARAPAVLC